jgi:hypothetical protein
MKKLFLIFLFVLLCATKCDKTPPELSSSYVFEQTYGINQEAQSISDLYTLLANYSQDSIPLAKWPAFMGINDDGFILQQMLTKRSDSINYIFIYNIHKIKDSTFYDIKVRKIILAK